MDAHIKFLLAITAYVLYNKKGADAKGIDWQRIYDLASKHGIVNIVAYGLKKGGYDMDPSVKALFMKKMYENVIVDENQSYEAKKLLAEFDRRGVSCMPLKGFELKPLYPSGDMRSMSDLDILIKAEELSKIREIMADLGYSFEYESNHEYAFKKPPCMFVELHKSLVPSYNDDLYAYYGDGWKFAKKTDSFIHKMSTEDCFIYLIVHFAKHYRDAGSGIKSVTDIRLYKEKMNPDMDYVYSELSKLGLDKFYKNLERLAACWFDNEPWDELSLCMMDFIMGSGEYGNKKNRTAAEVIRENEGNSPRQIKKGRYLRQIFPDMEFMKEKYPVLKKLPFMLPLFWVVRLFNIVLFKRKSIKTVKMCTGYITDENISGYMKHMKDVGLDIYNGRNKI